MGEGSGGITENAGTKVLHARRATTRANGKKGGVCDQDRERNGDEITPKTLKKGGGEFYPYERKNTKKKKKQKKTKKKKKKRGVDNGQEGNRKG